MSIVDVSAWKVKANGLECTLGRCFLALYKIVCQDGKKVEAWLIRANYHFPTDDDDDDDFPLQFVKCATNKQTLFTKKITSQKVILFTS